MQSFTIDAPVVLKWISHKNEPHLEQAKYFFLNGIQRKIHLIAPSLLKAEVTNILLKKKKLSVVHTRKALKIIGKSNIIFTELSDSLVIIAIKLAHQYDLSVYDGIYLACAEQSESILITDDEKGLGKINKVILLKNLEFEKRENPRV